MRIHNYHVPVMPAEVEKYLMTNGFGSYVDCTLGGGGYETILMDKYPSSKFIGVDWDEEAVARSRALSDKYGARFTAVRDNFKNMRNILSNLNISPVDGFLLDLGLSSRQIDDNNRGFRFDSEALDMRMDKRNPVSAETLVNTLDETALADIFFKYGEERKSRRIAERIVAERKKSPIKTSAALSSLVSRAKGREGKIHPATKVFQALRIAVNKELENLYVFMEEFPPLLNKHGRIVVLSYHSLEDRIVKQAFKKLAGEDTLAVLTKKIIEASDEEVRSNPRSRSAKLRAAERA